MDDGFPTSFIPVRSSWVSGLRYSAEKQALQVRFYDKSGTRVCEYPGINEDTYDDMFSAASKGKFVHAFLFTRPYTIVG